MVDKRRDIRFIEKRVRFSRLLFVGFELDGTLWSKINSTNGVHRPNSFSWQSFAVPDDFIAVLLKRCGQGVVIRVSEQLGIDDSVPPLSADPHPSYSQN